MERVRKKGVVYVVTVIVVVFFLLSGAIAIATVDKCGDESSPKHWSFFPPGWECESPNPFLS